MRVKVCGITRTEDAALCCRLGVHALGFNFYKGSSRFIEPEQAKEIAAAVPPFVYRVGVFVNQSDVKEVRRTAERVGLHALQFHGEETPEYCRGFGPWPVIKAFRVGGDFSPSLLWGFQVSAFLLDGFKPGEYGGTGVAAEWQMAAETAKTFPVILSGGLTVANVVEAVRRVEPLAVDVCSGVESEPGVKDPVKLEAFLQALRQL